MRKMPAFIPLVLFYQHKFLRLNKQTPLVALSCRYDPIKIDARREMIGNERGPVISSDEIFIDQHRDFSPDNIKYLQRDMGRLRYAECYDRRGVKRVWIILRKSIRQRYF